VTLELYAAYLVATAVVLILPGPTIMLVVSYALTEGRRSAWPTVLGVAAGDLVALTCSLAGLGAVLSTSATLFVVLKWAGAAYLVWLGIRMWRSEIRIGEGQAAMRPRAALPMAGHAFIVTALNPKGILFFIAFLPQFVSPAAPIAPQLVLLGGTFLMLAIVNAALYALLAGSVRDAVQRPGVMRAVQLLGGSVLIGAGILTATLRRTT
jgi:homoserine/homoserine lactone efflux protein